MLKMQELLISDVRIMISNHGGRQLDGSRSPFDQVKAISDAVGDKLNYFRRRC